MEAPLKKQPFGKHYKLSCPICGSRFADSPDAFLLSCPEPHAPALLRAVFDEPRFSVQSENGGVFRYAPWLPIRRVFDSAGGPVVFHSEGLGPAIGLEELYIVFSGFWPEKGAALETCSFKELEAEVVCARASPNWNGSVVVASAGNTARAFHAICAHRGVPATIVVPHSALPLLWARDTGDSVVRLVTLTGAADYADAIELGNAIAGLPGFYPEGGARNAARRDGMGTVLLAAVEATGRIPDHYIQAVGSGTGAIAVWEMMQRLAADGRYGEPVMRLHLSQNDSFSPMTDAWDAGSRSLAPLPHGREEAAAVYAPVLANRAPPYAVTGGLFDALADTRGYMYRVAAEEARAAGRLFERCEGIDIDPAAQVALASLREAVALGRIARQDRVVLNVTGGGGVRLRRERRSAILKPALSVSLEDISGPARETVIERIREACS